MCKGTAMEALPSMMSIINARPSTFKSLPDAIGWQYEIFFHILVSWLVLKKIYCSVHSGTVKNITSARMSVPSLVKKIENDPEKYTWRTNLHKTEKYWKGVISFAK